MARSGKPSLLSRWGYRLTGAFFFVLAMVATGTAAWFSAHNGPESGELAIALVILSATFQLGSVAMFAYSGRPDNVHASASVRRLIFLTERTQQLSLAAEDAIQQGKPSMQLALIDISARLNYIAQDTLASVEDWTSFNEPARRKVVDMNEQARRNAVKNVERDEGMDTEGSDG